MALIHHAMRAAVAAPAAAAAAPPALEEGGAAGNETVRSSGPVSADVMQAFYSGARIAHTTITIKWLIVAPQVMVRTATLAAWDQ
jgi:hypothetical protein